MFPSGTNILRNKYTLTVVPIRISLIYGCCLQWSYWTKGSCWLRWWHYFESFTFATMTWWTVMEYLCNKWTRIWSTSRSFPHWWLITRFIDRLTRRIPLVEPELLTLPEHLSSPPVFNWVSWYSIFSFLCLLCRSLFVLLSFFFGYCVVCFFELRILTTPMVSSNSF
jgi:hypothetical protein